MKTSWKGHKYSSVNRNLKETQKFYRLGILHCGLFGVEKCQRASCGITIAVNYRWQWKIKSYTFINQEFCLHL